MVMPRYFFHVKADGEVIRDLEGLELPGPEWVSGLRLKTLTDLIAAEEGFVGLPSRFEFQIADELGKILLIVPCCF